MGLNCVGPLICELFSINTTVLHDLQLVESVDAEPWIWRANYKVIFGFSTAQGVSTPNPYIVQGSTVYIKSHTPVNHIAN